MGLVGQLCYNWIITVPTYLIDMGHMGQYLQKYKRCKATYIAPLEIPAGLMEFAFANSMKKKIIFSIRITFS